MLSRFRSAARILLKGDPKENHRNPIPTIETEVGYLMPITFTFAGDEAGDFSFNFKKGASRYLSSL